MHPILKHPLIVTVGAIVISLHATPLNAADAELQALKKQVEALQGSVDKLQGQLNRSLLSTPFRETPESNAAQKQAVFEKKSTGEPGPSFIGSPPTPFANLNTSIAIDVVGSYSRRQNNVNIVPRDAEMMFQANVDPFAKAYLIVNAGSALAPTEKQDPFGEVNLSLEEAAIETTSLPFGMQLKAGQFFADFSRLGKHHPHELPFVDQPMAIESLIGGETKGRGIELSWVPDFGRYARLSVGALDNLGADRSALMGSDLSGTVKPAFKPRENNSLGSLTYYGRGATIFELGDSSFLHLGASALRGRDEGSRQLWGGDGKLVLNRTGGDALELGGEFLSGRQNGSLTYPLIGNEEGNANGKGGYLYAQYRIGKSWTPGIRVDYVKLKTLAEADADSDGLADSLESTTERRKALSAYLGYRFSEYQRLRLQVSYVKSSVPVAGESKADLQAFLQWTILLGNHSHGFTP